MPLLLLVLLLSATLTAAVDAQPTSPASRLRDIVTLEGARENQLLGYGLVVGLNGTGDKRQTFFSTQSLANMLERMGVQVNPQAMLVRNIAAVMVTANLPSYIRPGSKIDVTVAAIGDAQNLQGGILISTPLRAGNGVVYAVAQGSVVTGGFAAGRGGNSSTLNHPTAGRVPSGAIVEQAPPMEAPQGQLRLQLNRPDTGTAVRIARRINQKLGAESEAPVASAESAGVVTVRLPQGYRGSALDLYADIEAVAVESSRSNRILINERTGTIVLGRDLPIAPSAIMHGALSVEITTRFDVSQPAPLSTGQTVTVPEVRTSVKEEKAKNISLDSGATVDDLVLALKAIGSTARDIIAILQALKASGALDAEIEVI
jgi:flagellar P-ring protein FlgI